MTMHRGIRAVPTRRPWPCRARSNSPDFSSPEAGGTMGGHHGHAGDVGSRAGRQTPAPVWPGFRARHISHPDPGGGGVRVSHKRSVLDWGRVLPPAPRGKPRREFCFSGVFKKKSPKSRFQGLFPPTNPQKQNKQHKWMKCTFWCKSPRNFFCF